MLRTHGYYFKGQRWYESHNWGTKGRTNVIGACSIILSFFLASTDIIIFTGWLKQYLLPNLSPNSVIVLENASFHKGKEMQEAVESVGHILLYLLPYSSDLNPIENKWAQVKSVRRKYKCSIKDLFVRYVK